METKKKKTFKDKWEDFKWKLSWWWSDTEIYRVILFYFTIGAVVVIGAGVSIIAIAHTLGVL